MSRSIWIDPDLNESKAFRSLKRVSILVLFDFYKKRRMKEVKTSTKRSSDWEIINNGKIVYTYEQAKKKGLSSRQFRDSLDDLSEKGFLSIKHQGSGGRGKDGKDGDVTLFNLDDRWKDFGTKRFRKVEKPRVKDTRQGRGWASLMNDPKKKAEILKKRERTIKKKLAVKNNSDKDSPVC